MRASQGIPHGPKARLYHPELFNDHEEVIVYEREEFRRNFMHIRESINNIIMTDLNLNLDEEWTLMGHWPRIMERIHLINLGLNSFFSEKPVQSSLDTYLHESVKVNERELLKSLSNQPIESMGLDWL